MSYSIIIPIYNEFRTLKKLLKELKHYHILGHEIIIVDDGSNDRSVHLLKNSFINLIRLKKNSGKGIAIRKGLIYSKNDKVIIYDGDLELETKDISKFFYLDREKRKFSIMGYRFKNLNPTKSSDEWGNFIFTVFF